ncbi:SCO family protein [Nostoc ellipsosporum NOK]|nr:SCO family protein [Nostoc ellipsosporum NOK]
MKKNTTLTLFVLIVFAVPFTVYAMVNLYERKWETLPVFGKKDHHVAAFTMQNQNGVTVTEDRWKDKIVVANFFFTRCPVICPKMTSHLRQVQQAFAGDPGVWISSFTVDPENDSSAQLSAYAHRFALDTHQWDLLTGDKKAIYALARNSFLVVATDGDGGPNDFIHSEKLVLLDKQQRVRGYYDGTSDAEVAQLLTDIKKLKHEK